MESESSLIENPLALTETLWRDTVLEKSIDIIEKIKAKDQALVDLLNVDMGALLSERLKQKETEIPSITYCKSLSELRALNKKLVKIQLMVQNLFDPEIFSAFFVRNQADINTPEDLLQNVFNLKFRDDDIDKVLPVEYDMDGCLLTERDCLLGIPVPGESPWVEECVLEEVSGKKAGTEDKRVNELSQSGIVREVRGTKIDLSSEMREVWPQLKNNRIIDHNSVNRLSFLVKVYNAQREKAKLNDIIEIIGILSFPTPLPAGEEAESMKEEIVGFEMDLNTHYPIETFPRIHALSINKISSDMYLNNFPRLAEVLPSIDFQREFLTIKKLLNELTLGDELVSRFILFAALGRSRLTQGGSNPLGKNILNIYKLRNISFAIEDSTAPLTFSQALRKFFQQLLPKTEFFQLNLKSLHEQCFKSVIKGNCPELGKGALQLTDGTFIIIDETKMEPGTLNEFALNNVKAVNDLLEFQKTKYNFIYFETELDTEIPAIITSEGKSFLKHDLGIPMTHEGIQKLSNNVLNVLGGKSEGDVNLPVLRTYLMKVRENVKKVQISAEVAKRIEDDYIAERQKPEKKAGKKEVDGDDLHVWINLGKISSALRGELNLSFEDYLEAKSLEVKRLERI